MLQKLKRKIFKTYTIKYKNKKLFNLSKIKNKDILIFNYMINKRNWCMIAFKYSYIDKENMLGEVQLVIFKKIHIKKFIYQNMVLASDEVETNLDKNSFDKFLLKYGIENVLPKQKLLVQRAREYKSPSRNLLSYLR